MADHHLIFIVSSLLMVLVAFQGTQAVQYEVTNAARGKPGGIRFDNEIGVDYSRQTLESAVAFIWQIFRQSTDADRRNVQVLLKMVVDPNYGGIAASSNDEIHVSANHIASYSGDVKTHITGVLYHEVTHSFQWNGNGQASSELIEGIADYVVLKANYETVNSAKPGDGDRWDQGYAVTARFLEYCNSLKDGFVADLNNKMRTSYNDNFFVELLGKPVDQLWSDYKTAYRRLRTAFAN